MDDCTRAVYSEDYYDLIIEAGEQESTALVTSCMIRIYARYYAAYLNSTGLPEFGVRNYSYTAIPNLFATVDIEAMEASEIVQIQNQPALGLKGQGVLVGIIDTGIDYENPVFRYSDGTTRIAAIWDQTIVEGPAPEGFFYGAEYRTEQINAALAMEDPQQLVPSRDVEGHGTYVASLAAGNENRPEGFIGAAPYATLAVVKLKRAKKYLRDYYFVPEDVAVYQENDIMAAVFYLDNLALELKMPMALCIGLGSNQGNHGGRGPLSNVLDSISTRRMRAVCVPTGNEANKQHHFYGSSLMINNYQDVEINVGPDVAGFTMELWSTGQEIFTVEIISPTGDRTGRIGVNVNYWDFNFVFENTRVSIEKNITFVGNDYRLIFMRFVSPSQGVWTLRVYAENTFYGNFHIWLPLEELQIGRVYFISSNPDTTITVPGDSRLPITVAGYNIRNNSLFLDSGRGYTISGNVKPDLAAPAVEILGASAQNRFVPRTGTSGAAAIATGAVALILEWAVVRGNDSQITSSQIKNMLVQGAARDKENLYPNREWGYGRLDLYGAFSTRRNV